MVMLHQTLSTETTHISMTETIKSRFGEITVDTSKAVSFPRGLLGMPDKRSFALAPFPSPKMQQFTLLQSLDEKALAFITLPIPMENAIVAAKDLRLAAQDLQIADLSLGNTGDAVDG